MVNTHEWLDLIIDVLCEPDTRRFKKIVDELNKQNSAIKGQNFFGFIHLGVRFIDSRYTHQAKALSKVQVPTLSLQLNQEAKEFRQDYAKVDADMDKIRQALMPLLVNCLSLQDIRDSLPECIVQLIPRLSCLPRVMADNTVHIRSNKYALKAYEKALPLMQAYSVAALIY